MDYIDLIREVPDFPQRGILFRDITPLLKDPLALNQVVTDMSAPFVDQVIDVVVAVEARGYILGAPIAHRLGSGFIPIRKQGKLPWRTSGVSYSLEYGTAVLEMHVDAVELGQKVLIVDDIVATGGTLRAAISLVEEAGGEVRGISVLADIKELGTSGDFEKYNLVSLKSI